MEDVGKIEVIDRYSIAYTVTPFKRNQDLVEIKPSKAGKPLVISVIDGYSNPRKIKDDIVGKEAAKFVADKFPELFLESKGDDYQKRANKVAKIVDGELIKIFPEAVSCVAAFLFAYKEQEILVVVGDITILLWDEKWSKPKEIGDYQLNIKGLPDVTRFFGLGDFKDDPLYSCKADVLTLKPKTALLMASDGLTKALSLEEINRISKEIKDNSPKKLTNELLVEVQEKGIQNDDIAILVRSFNE